MLTLNHPSRLALNTKLLAENPRFAPLRGISAAPARHSPGSGQRRGDAGSPLPAARKPRAPQSPLPAKSSLCAAAGSRLAASGPGASTQGGDQRPWLSSHLLHLVKKKKKNLLFVNCVFDPGFLSKLILPHLQTSTCPQFQKPTKRVLVYRKMRC